MQTVQLSDSAATRILALRTKENNPKLMLRVTVLGGGCSGFQYGFSFDETICEDDTIIEQSTSDGETRVRLVIDAMSYPYLHDAEVDYTQGIQGEQFVIRNPNAKTTCGCGSSFSIEDDE